MWEDPIVAEVHRTREKLAAEFDFDVEAIFADLRRRQTALGNRLVSPRKRPEPAAGSDRDGCRTAPPASASADAAPAA